MRCITRFVCLVSVAQEVPAYRDAKLPVEERVAELRGRMTLEEKGALMEEPGRTGEI